MSSRDAAIYLITGSATTLIVQAGWGELLRVARPGRHTSRAKPNTPPEPARGVAPADPRPAALQPVAVPAPPRPVNGGPR